MKVALVAGEASGDLLGAGFIEAFRARVPEASFEGIAGPRMVQAGCTVGDGSGKSPFGPIPAEFSQSEAARHRYGTLSMARGRDPDSAGAQFVVVCRAGPLAWSLDGRYTSFGQLVSGGEALEAIRGVERQANALGEPSDPVPAVRILRAEVVAGPAPPSTLLEPALAPEHRWGPPNTVSVESLMVAYEARRDSPSSDSAGRNPARSQEEALARARELEQRWKSGEDFHQLILDESDDPVQRVEPVPGPLSDGLRPFGMHFAQRGSNPLRGQREVQAANDRARLALQEVAQRKRSGELSPEEAAQRRDEIQWLLQGTIRKQRAIPFDEWPDLAQRAFELQVGESAVVVSERSTPFRGVFVLRRVE